MIKIFRLRTFTSRKINASQALILFKHDIFSNKLYDFLTNVDFMSTTCLNLNGETKFTRGARIFFFPYPMNSTVVSVFIALTEEELM